MKGTYKTPKANLSRFHYFFMFHGTQGRYELVFERSVDGATIGQSKRTLKKMYQKSNKTWEFKRSLFATSTDLQLTDFRKINFPCKKPQRVFLGPETVVWNYFKCIHVKNVN